MPKRALISVSNKEGVVSFAEGLVSLGWEIVSTGGTARVLSQAGVPVIEVSKLTGFPEIMDGRVKTLHPKVHGGILARRGVDDGVLAEHGIAPIDLVCVNLYPFRETIARADCSLEEAIEQIDIGGPAMIRAAAKNHRDVLVVVDPADYPLVLEALRCGNDDAALRRTLAAKAFAHTAAYDGAIAGYLSSLAADGSRRALPDLLHLALVRAPWSLRYGENPHQEAAFYADLEDSERGIADGRLLQGKALSFNNIADADAAYACVRDLPQPACVIVKHMNPCGAAVGANAADAYRRAYEADPVSAFGGIVAFNVPVDAEAAEEIAKVFTEVVIAPGFDDAARKALAKKKNLRLLAMPHAAPIAGGWDLRRVAGGLLVQRRDAGVVRKEACRVVTKRAPSDEEWRDLLFAWAIVKHLKSNAIALAHRQATVGLGMGQTSRVVAARLAVEQAKERAQGAVAASDAFFPFRDGVDALAEAGVRAVIQPGGSVRDAEVIAAADEHGIAMVFTDRRAFRH